MPSVSKYAFSLVEKRGDSITTSENMKKSEGSIFSSLPFQLQDLTVTNLLQFDKRGVSWFHSTKCHHQNSLDYVQCPSSKITMNHFILLGKDTSRKPRGSVIGGHLNTTFLTKLRTACHHLLSRPCKNAI